MERLDSRRDGIPDNRGRRTLTSCEVYMRDS